MRTNPQPRLFNNNCPKCYGTLEYPTPWVGRHAQTVICDCPGGMELNRRMQAGPDGSGVIDDKNRLWAGISHRQELLIACDIAAWVDAAIAGDVRCLWEAGILTWASCQGDDSSYRYVAITYASQTAKARALLPWAVGTKEMDFAVERPTATLYGPKPPRHGEPAEGSGQQ